jgi:hypothetical protein
VSLVRRIASSPEYREALQNSMVAVIVDSDAVSYPVELYYTTVYPALFIVESTTEIFLTPPCRGEECLALPPLPERKKIKDKGIRYESIGYNHSGFSIHTCASSPLR